MTKFRNIIFVLSLTAGLLSCGDQNADSEVIVDQERFVQTNNLDDIGFNQNEIPFKGGIIHLANEGQAENNYTIQEITKQKRDIKFRAKRIPTELYLLNKGVLEAELGDALAEVEGEQLFYFEFEEELKQDLVKKYLETDLDGNISYLSFGIYQDFLLVNSQGDTIQSNYSLYERNFHVAPYERILLSFSGIDQNEEVQLIYNDKLFGRGQLDFAFASNAFVENNIKNPS
jgi:hypothetical protein